MDKHHNTDRIYADVEEIIERKQLLEDDIDLKRRLLNLPQQPSSHRKKSTKTSPGPTSGNYRVNQSTNKSKNEPKPNTPKAEFRQLTNNENNKQSLKEKGKEKVKKGAKKATKKVAKKAVKKGAKQLGKVAARVLKTLIVKGITLATKALLALAATVGLPAILIGLAIVLIIILLMTLSSIALGTGSGVDEMGDDALALREYIVELSNSSIDADKPEQMPYRVPEELLAAIVQLDSITDQNISDLESGKELLNTFAEKLKPEFTYETFNEWTQTSKRECVDFELVDNEEEDTIEIICKKYEWTEPKQTDKKVKKITKVVAWNGTGTFEYEPEVSDWKVDGNTRTRKRTYVIKEQNFEYDFSKLDEILNSRGYNIEDKRMFEFFYESATQTPMRFMAWLENGSIDFGGGFGFDGEIIPGAGVPPQFMPYYLAAEEKYGTPWYILAAVHFEETRFSTDPTMVSSVGAIGHMQFMPKTWIGWNYPGGNKLGNANIPMHILTDPAQIRKYGGYGTDANGDGKADPWDVEDAIHSAAKYLAANNVLTNPNQALRAYNNSTQYVNNVLANAERFKREATYIPNDMPEITDGAFMRPATGRVTSPYGPRWGSFHHGIDIGLGGRSNVPIVAAADGVVSRSYRSDSYGHCVMIKHNINGKQYETVYAHMQNRAVTQGQKVKKGQFLGYMGATGDAKGPHLHFEIHSPSWNGAKSNSLNPVFYVDF